MRVLLINDLDTCGGAEIQLWTQYHILKEHGLDVATLTLDDTLPLCSTGPHFNLPVLRTRTRTILRRSLPIANVLIKKKIKKILNNYKPNIIHINNASIAPYAVYGAVRKYPCVQTLHDFEVVCPKGSLILTDGSPCTECRRGITCKEKCMSGIKKRILASWVYPRILRARSRASSVFVTPSEALAKACAIINLPALCINNPIDVSKEVISKNDDKEPKHEKVYLFVGRIEKLKGAKHLLEAFTTFSRKHPDTSLSFIGRIDPHFQKDFTSFLDNAENISYLGPMSHNETIEQISKAYCVVVPSVLTENYPNVAIEALIEKTLVLGSNRGGIPELIPEDQIFDILSKKSIIETLEKAYFLNKDEYAKKISHGFNYVISNNSQDLYFKKISDIYRRVLSASNSAQEKDRRK